MSSHLNSNPNWPNSASRRDLRTRDWFLDIAGRRPPWRSVTRPAEGSRKFRESIDSYWEAKRAAPERRRLKNQARQILRDEMIRRRREARAAGAQVVLMDEVRRTAKKLAAEWVPEPEEEMVAKTPLGPIVRSAEGNTERA